jgi:hypothetical protein
MEIVAAIVQQALWVGLHDARGEPLSDQPTLTVPAIRVETVADDAPPVANRIGHHGDEAGRHLGKIDIGVADR